MFVWGVFWGVGVAFFMSHISLLVCIVEITYVYIIQYLCFMGTFFCYAHLYCFVRCVSKIVWTLAVLGVLYACVLYFCICACLAQLSVFHMERCSRQNRYYL